MWNSNIHFLDGGKRVLIVTETGTISMSYETYLENFKK